MNRNQITLIDTNIFLAAMRTPVIESDVAQHQRAASLLANVASGETRALVSEVVLHECFYVLTMRDKVIGVDEFCSTFRQLLVWPGWAMEQHECAIYLRGLDILQQYPKLEFSDAVLAARAEAHGAILATYDRRLAKAYGDPIWADS